MKHLKWLAAVSILTLSAIQLSVAADAEHKTNKCEKHAHHQKHEKGHDRMGMRGPMHLLKKLDLTDEQHKEISQIFEAEHAAMQSKHQEKMALMQQLHEAARQKTLDQTHVNKVASQIGAMAQAMAVQKAQTGHRVYALLTTEQQAEFETLIQEKKQKRSAYDKSAKHVGVNHAVPAQPEALPI